MQAPCGAWGLMLFVGLGLIVPPGADTALGLDLTSGGDETVEWFAEFADFTEGGPDAKGYSKLQIRFELEEGAQASVELQYDSSGVWQTVGGLTGGRKRSAVLPVIPRRADHYRLRISGRGGAVIHSITRQYYHGSEQPTQ